MRKRKEYVLIWFVLIAILLFYVLYKEDALTDYFGILASIIATIVFGVLLNIFAFQFFESKYSTQYSYSRDLVAVADNRDIGGRSTGNVFVSTGYIETTMYYYYMLEETYGQKQYTSKGSHTYINETNDEPSIEYFKTKIEIPFWLCVFSQGTKTDYNIINVPVGTITDDFNIDLQ